MNQMSIFDLIEVPVSQDSIKDIPLGYLKDGEEKQFVGRELRFQELKDLIGKKCIVSNSTYSYPDFKISNTWYKVIKITQYFEGCDKVYRKVKPIPEGCIQYGEFVNDYIHDNVGQEEAMDCYEVAYICDRVGFTDKDKSDKSNGWVSEMYCNNGRHEPATERPETFYELKM